MRNIRSSRSTSATCRSHSGGSHGFESVASLSSTNWLNLSIALPLRHQDKQASWSRTFPIRQAQITAITFPPRNSPRNSGPRLRTINRQSTTPEQRLARSRNDPSQSDIARCKRTYCRTRRLKMQVYQHPTEGRTFFAPDAEPSVDFWPADFAHRRVGKFFSTAAAYRLPCRSIKHRRLPTPVPASVGPTWAMISRAAYMPGLI